MAINMPHEGGLECLKVLFGTNPKDETFRVFLWINNMVDYDDNDIDDANLVNMSGDYSTEYETGTLHGELVTASTLQGNVLVIGGVPQVEFPAYECTFKSTFDTEIYGYAIKGAGSTGVTEGKVYFREKFTAPFAPAGKKLMFIPTLKLGNTTSPLT